jgi:hypothetical protein
MFNIWKEGSLRVKNRLLFVANTSTLLLTAFILDFLTVKKEEIWSFGTSVNVCRSIPRLTPKTMFFMTIVVKITNPANCMRAETQ